MGYATQQDMIDRFDEQELIQLTDRNRIGTIDVTVLSQALADADAMIDGYLIGRYTLPLATVPKTLVRLACNIARYFLYDDHAPDQVTNLYNEAVKFLASVGKGDLHLGLDVTQKMAATAGGAQAVSNDRVFSSTTLKDY